jgi:hypothetical protein
MKTAIYRMLAGIGTTYQAGEVPQNTPGAYIAIQRVARAPHHHLSGIPALQEETYQIDCYGDTEAEASDLAEDVRHELDGASVEIGAEWAVVENVMDDYDAPRSGGERPKFRTLLTVRVFWQEGD